MTIGVTLRQAIDCLERHSVAESRAAAEVLLADLLETTRLRLYLEAAQTLSTRQQAAYQERLQRRLQGEPVQYITGKQAFWSLEFTVNPAVLIPRPESELLVEHGLRLAQAWGTAHPQSALDLLDVGTGSGALAVSLAAALPQAGLLAIDCSWQALRVAQHNACQAGVAQRVSFVMSDLATALRPGMRRFAVCVANLPYVTTDEWQHLPRDIKEYEPVGALCGGEDGLALIRRLIPSLPDILAPGGTLLLEVGWQQATTVVNLVRQQAHFGAVGVYHDFAGIERIVWAQRVQCEQ